VVAVALVAVFIYAILTAAVALRLLTLWVRTRELAALLSGSAYLFGGVLGWAFIIFGVACQASAPTLSRLLGCVGLFFFSSGTLCTALFSWRVFSPNSSWTRALFWLLFGVLAIDYVHGIGVLGVPFPPTSSPWYYPGMLARSTILAWAPIAALSHYRRLRLRLSLGLADPEATNRVLLWGLSSAATFLATVIVVVGTLAGPLNAPYGESSARPPLIIVIVGLIAGGAVLNGLAFLPPKRYVAWVESRAGRGGRA
jgi:hypothetical protein